MVSCDNFAGGDHDTDPIDNDLLMTSIQEISEFEIYGGTETLEFEVSELQAIEESPNGRHSEKFGRKGPKFGDKRKAKHDDLGGIYRELNLTEDQKALLRQYLKEQKDCAKIHFEALRAIQKEIASKYNEQRKAILTELKAGNMTREEAKLQLDALRDAMKAELDASTDRLATIEALKACRDEFIAKVGSMLDEDQLITWNAWLEQVSIERTDDRPVR